MASILATGIATLDIICLVDEYPQEDDEIRARGRVLRRGGNAANSLTILSQLGHQCAWAGTIAADDAASMILSDIESYGISTAACRLHSDGETPTSYVWRSLANGSRTITHWRDLPEYAAEDFFEIDLEAYDWLHFEGRNIPETLRMLRHQRQKRPEIPVSIEIEKYREHTEDLFVEADVLIFSRDYALHKGFSSARALLEAYGNLSDRQCRVCTWGSDGAWAQAPGKKVFHVPASPPETLVDTLGAGDTFNAGLIDGILRGLSFEDAVSNGCRIAGRKCGLEGLSIQ